MENITHLRRLQELSGIKESTQDGLSDQQFSDVILNYLEHTYGITKDQVKIDKLHVVKEVTSHYHRHNETIYTYEGTVRFGIYGYDPKNLNEGKFFEELVGYMHDGYPFSEIKKQPNSYLRIYGTNSELSALAYVSLIFDMKAK